MYRLFETIRVCNREPENLFFHNERMNRSRRILFGMTDKLSLADHLNFPESDKTVTFRCRVIYAETIISVDFSLYEMTDIKTLKAVDAGSLNYDHKFLDRSHLTSLIDKSVADDILVIRNGCVTDTSFSNIAFTDGRDWVTPDTPLLPGTMRALLLKKGSLKQERIKIDQLNRFTHYRLINAMLGFDGPLREVSSII